MADKPLAAAAVTGDPEPPPPPVTAPVHFNNTEFVTLTLVPTSGGEKSNVIGVPVWTISDTRTFSLIPAPNGMTALLQAADPILIGKGHIIVTAQVGRGDYPANPVPEFETTQFDVQIVGGETDKLTVVPSKPQPRVI